MAVLCPFGLSFLSLASVLGELRAKMSGKWEESGAHADLATGIEVACSSRSGQTE